ASRDHRLRVMLPTDVKTDYAYADGPFDILKRRIQWQQTGENMESHHPFKPMLNFVSLTDGNSGISFLGKGLNEYEVVDDARRTLAVTLLRTTRHYMAANRGLFTPEEYARHSGQHCLGDIEYEYAVYMHGGDLSKANVFNVSQDYKVEQRILQGVPKAGQMPASGSFINIAPSEHVHVSALYKAEDNKRYILRIWNSGTEPVNARIGSAIGFRSVKKISMDQENVLEELVCNKGTWSVSLRQSEIATLAIEIQQ
ncbi:MAG: glycoside hydrolase family 38 C-terminal domain-containing protein, partial [Verrucomicrobiota bacterium]